MVEAVIVAVEQLLPHSNRTTGASPVRRIWADERDGAALTAGLDPNSALIVREILKRLK